MLYFIFLFFISVHFHCFCLSWGSTLSGSISGSSSNTRRWPIADLLLGQRRRRWLNKKHQYRFVFADSETVLVFFVITHDKWPSLLHVLCVFNKIYLRHNWRLFLSGFIGNHISRVLISNNFTWFNKMVVWIDMSQALHRQAYYF